MDHRPLRRIADRRPTSPGSGARRRLAALLLALPTLLALPVPLLAAKPPGGETPQALVERLRAAAAKDDFAELVECIAPADRREMAAGLVLGTTMMVAFLDMGSDMAMGMAEGVAGSMSDSGEPTAEQKADMEKAKAEAKAKTAELRGRYDGILKKHGLTDRMESLQAEGNDGGGSPEEAIGKLLAGVDERALIADLMGFMSALGESQGSDRKPLDLPAEITDYKIDGDHATAKAGDETVEFVRVDGRWYMAPSKDKPPASP